MKKQITELPVDGNRRMKFVEAGMLFVLALGLTVFLGLKVLQGDGASDAPAVSQVGTEAAWQAPAEVATASVADSVAPEPDVAVEAAAPAPELPTLITYANAEAAYFAHHYDEAAEMFAQYCDAHAENAWGHYMHGLALWKAGHDDDAATAFHAALALKPDHLKSLVNLARVELERGDAEAALASVQAAVDLAPDDVAARRVLGRAYHSLGQRDAASEAYVEVLRSQPDDVWTLNNLGLVRIEQERYGDALPALARAATLAPDVAVIQNNLGMALECTGHLAQAKSAYAAALDRDGRAAHAEANLIRIEDLGDLPVSDPVDLAALGATFTVTPPATPVAPSTAAVAAVTIAPDSGSQKSETE